MYVDHVASVNGFPFSFSVDLLGTGLNGHALRPFQLIPHHRLHRGTLSFGPAA